MPWCKFDRRILTDAIDLEASNIICVAVAKKTQFRAEKLPVLNSKRLYANFALESLRPRTCMKWTTCNDKLQFIYKKDMTYQFLKYLD
jgi:hypothetical protein